MRLENKVGIVTAAASGMGRAGAIRFAREGAAVGVVDIDQAGVDAVAGERLCRSTALRRLKLRLVVEIASSRSLSSGGA